MPANIIDALIGYAIDPERWEILADELENNGTDLSQLDQASLLTTLSQVEALAWELKGQPELSMQQVGCVFFLLDEHGKVLQASDTASTLQDYCRVEQDHLNFASSVSRQSFDTALAALQNEQDHQVLVELHGDQPHCRYGYLVNAEGLPMALNLPRKGIHYGFLIAQPEASVQTHKVLQSTFGLTAAEIALCRHLSAGLVIKEVARELGISPNTARNHLQSIFDKTNVNRQNDLILMMTQLSVILSVISTHGKSNLAKNATHLYPSYQFLIARGQDQPRRIAYRVYGDGPHHVVYFHESAGTSRLLPGTHQIASRLGLSLVAAERPGTGFSDELRGYDFNSTARDVEYLLDELNIGSVSLLGFLAGGAHALATAALLGERIRRVMLVAARGTRGLSYAGPGSLPSLRRRLTTQPWLLSSFFNILHTRVSKETNRRLAMRVYGANPNDRRYLEEHPEVLEHMVGYTMEALTVTGAGAAGEISCFNNPAPVDLSRISAPLTVWHGDQDQVSSFASLIEELAELSFESRIFAGRGSTILFEFWEEILQYLAQSAQAG